MAARGVKNNIRGSLTGVERLTELFLISHEIVHLDCPIKYESRVMWLYGFSAYQHIDKRVETPQKTRRR